MPTQKHSTQQCHHAQMRFPVPCVLHSPCRKCRAAGHHASRTGSAAGPRGPPVLGGERMVRACHGLGTGSVFCQTKQALPCHPGSGKAFLAAGAQLCTTLTRGGFPPEQFVIADFSSPGGPHVCHTDHKANTVFFKTWSLSVQNTSQDSAGTL